MRTNLILSAASLVLVVTAQLAPAYAQDTRRVQSSSRDAHVTSSTPDCSSQEVHTGLWKKVCG